MFSLCGTVTFTPARSRLRIARAASRRFVGRTGNGTYTYGNPKARNAALCIAGERLCATGSPKMPITRVAPVTRPD